MDNNDWQPIETAPKDGRLILGFDARYPRDKHAQAFGAVAGESDDLYRVAPFEVICWIEQRASHLIQVDRDNFKRVQSDRSHWARSQGSWYPTHWQPLPAPPEADK